MTRYDCAPLDLSQVTVAEFEWHCREAWTLVGLHGTGRTKVNRYEVKY